MVKTIQTKRVHYNDLIDNKVIDKCFGQETRFTFSVTVFDVKKSKTIGSSDATAASIELNGFKSVSATSEGQTHDSPVQKTWSETQSAELRVSNSESQTQSAQGNLSEIKTEKFITEVHLKQLHAEKCRTATSSSISHSASDASRRVPQALRVRGSNLRRSDLSSLESKNSGEENQKSRRQSVRASAAPRRQQSTPQRVQRSTFSTTTSKCWSHSSAAQRQQQQNCNLSRSQSQSQSAHLPAQQLRVKESQPQTQRLKLHDLNDKHFQSSTQTGQSETQAGELRELKRATSDSEAQRQEVKEPQQELTRSTTETHGVKAKESRSSTTETQGVKAKRERVKLHFAETQSTRVRTLNPQTSEQRRSETNIVKMGLRGSCANTAQTQTVRPEEACQISWPLSQSDVKDIRALNLPHMLSRGSSHQVKRVIAALT